MLYILLWIVHVLVCLFLIIVVLLQSGKAADLAGAFGGMGTQTAFGPRGSATLLSKATTISFVVFMITSMWLSIIATRSAGLATTVLEGVPSKGAPTQQAPAPGVPGGPGSAIPQPVTPTPVPLPPIQVSPPQPVPGKAPTKAPVKK